MLILFRVLQGLVAGPLIPLSQSLLLNNYPPAKRNMALALWSMTIVIAPICGPILGGYISDNYHWGWIFLSMYHLVLRSFCHHAHLKRP